MAIVSSIPRPVGTTITPNSPSSTAWRRELKEAVRDPDVLCQLLNLETKFVEPAQAAAAAFGLFAPRGYISRMRRGDPHDPLLRQVVPLGEETIDVEGFSTDPVDDAGATIAPGTLKKYARRALLVTTGACAIHCRYCFRRHFPYAGGPRSVEAWQPALEKIAADESLDEILLSGGDPLTLVDEQLAELAGRLALIPHLKRLRIHTRLPIVIPARVTDELLAWLRGTRLAPIMVVHANHPAEFDEAVTAALARLIDSGIPVLNQSVLLRGVNDNAETLIELSRRLVDNRVMPYYLHQLDRVRGAAHFDVPIARGMQIIDEMRARLPGYAVPRYVQEIPGEPGKTVLG